MERATSPPGLRFDGGFHIAFAGLVDEDVPRALRGVEKRPS